MSPIFLRGDSIFIPALFVARIFARIFEKTPHPSSSCHLRNVDVERVQKALWPHELRRRGCCVQHRGLEQELFFVPRGKYYSARTFSSPVARWARCADQEGCGHYMGAPTNMNGPVLKCMHEIQFECYTCAGGRAFEPPSSIRTSGGRTRPWGFSSRSAAVRRRRRSSSSHSSSSTMRFCSALTHRPEPGSSIWRIPGNCARFQGIAPNPRKAPRSPGLPIQNPSQGRGFGYFPEPGRGATPGCS
jgi:hypothetical protein